MSARKRRPIAADYFGEVEKERRAAVAEKAAPPSKAKPSAAPEREKATFYLRRDVLDELRAASLMLPPLVLGGSLSALVERALERELEALRRRHNEGEPFEASGPVRKGRPPKR